MNRLRISWTELRQQPYEETLIIEAFIRGEAQAREIQKEPQ